MNNNLNNTKKEEESTKDELLQEVRKLRKEVEKENKEKQRDRGYSGLIWIGLILILIAFFIWRCSGLF